MIKKETLLDSLEILELDDTCSIDDISNKAKDLIKITEEQKDAIGYLLEYYSYIKYINILSDDDFEEEFYKKTEKYKNEISKYYLQLPPVREFIAITPFILMFLATLTIIIPIIYSVNFRLRQEFESELWICDQTECFLHEGNQNFTYNFETDNIHYVYSYRDDFNTEVNATVNITIINSQAIMTARRYHENVLYDYSYYGNVITSSYTCHTTDPNLTLCVDGHIVSAYSKVMNILKGSNVTIQDIKDDRK